MKRRLMTFVQVRLINPRRVLRAGKPGDPCALLETVGRKSGKRHQIPVGYGLDGNVLWIVAHHGRAAAYVQNLLADPHVKVQVEGAWRTGTAHLVPDDDAVRRLESLDPGIARAAKQLGTSLLTIRVDLDAVQPDPQGRDQLS
jgi:deazaflavin-dependent oxidoreductase (nitroreductase family)